jgi:polyhydroxyalkanoate synthase subunit PhaC
VTTLEATWSRAWWTFADSLRQRQADLFDRVGLGLQTTPARLVRRRRAVDLLAFHGSGTSGPTLLIIPAPIKTWHIWDLAPEISVIRRCLDAGLRVYLMAWRRPPPDGEEMGLAQYANELVADCLHAVAIETGERQAFLAGHSLGGTLAAIFTSLHPDEVRGLVELEGPMQFDPRTGCLEAAVHQSPASRVVTDVLGHVPGAFLDLASSWADPFTFVGQPLLDWLGSLPDARARRVYLQVRRWTLDEMPMPRRLFEELVEELYRNNRFAEGTLEVAGTRADPGAIVAPILAVFDPRSRTVPPAAVAAYGQRTRSPEVRLIAYGGDLGVMLQHVGVLVGENAHRTLWPTILGWIHDHAGPP